MLYNRYLILLRCNHFQQSLFGHVVYSSAKPHYSHCSLAEEMDNMGKVDHYGRTSARKERLSLLDINANFISNVTSSLGLEEEDYSMSITWSSNITDTVLAGR